MAKDIQQLWSGSVRSGAALTGKLRARHLTEVKYRPMSLWWYVMLLALVVALAETALASEYIGTQREEI